MLNSNAVQNELTSKPSTNLSQSNTIAALMTNKNNPSVKTVTGKVKKTNIGFKKVFSNPKTTDTIKAIFKVPNVEVAFIETPFIRYVRANTMAIVINNLCNNFIAIIIFG